MALTRRTLASGAVAALAAPVAAARETSLKAAARRSGRLYGCAVEPHRLDEDTGFAALAARECAALIPENAMKWDTVRHAEGRFDFAAADRLLAQADAMGAVVHGHCLLWHEALPAWFPERPDERLLRGHVGAVVGRYAGRVRSWDVVNEAVERNDRRPDGLRRSPWLETLGPAYLRMAFEAAHEADPAARLALADYGLEYDDVVWMTEKRGTMLALLGGLVKAGVPIHALSIQGHLRGEQAPSFGRPLADFLRRVADLGLEIYVTELDVRDDATAGDAARRDRNVADHYRRFLDTALAEPAVRMVCTWGLSDRYSATADFFPRPDGARGRPLPFDADLRPKPAAKAMRQAFGRI